MKMKTKASGSDLQSLLCISLSRKKAGGVAAARSPRVPDGMRVARAAQEADVGSMSGLPGSGRRSALSRCRTSARSHREQMQQPVCRSQTYSITSSASATTVGGMSRPSVLAVLRLITSSYFVGCMTGRSDGLVPIRIFPTYTPIWRYASGRCAP
jgi:hypothetical protein